jgi:hypothetical protein
MENDFANEINLNNSSAHISTSLSARNSTRQKFIWRGHINKLATIFYELTNTELHEGKPVLTASSQELTDFLYDSFLDKNGKELSRDTINTILRPGRADKRSPIHKKYNIPS